MVDIVIDLPMMLRTGILTSPSVGLLFSRVYVLFRCEYYCNFLCIVMHITIEQRYNIVIILAATDI